MPEILVPPAHNHVASIPCKYGCPRHLHYVMQEHRCTANLGVTSDTVGWKPEQKPVYICGQPMPCPDHEDTDRRKGAKRGGTDA